MRNRRETVGRTLGSPRKEQKRKRLFLTLLGTLVLGAAIWLGMICFEGQKPEIHITLENLRLGREQEIAFEITEAGRGIKEYRVTFEQGFRDFVLAEKEFPGEEFLWATGVAHTPVQFSFKPSDLGVKDGEGTLRIWVRDASFRRLFKGNVSVWEAKVFVDTEAPEIFVATRNHYLSQGGAGLVAYRVSEPVRRSGVMVDGEFFPGHAGFGPKKDIYLAFFGIGHTPGSGKEIFLTAEDFAGNTGKSGFQHMVNSRRFKKDTITIKDRFLAWKMPEFKDPPEKSASLIEKFLFVNGPGRKADENFIFAAARESLSEILWESVFMPLPSSANRGGFADHRTYYYEGQEIDKQYHMGIDLASVSQAPIPAAARGRVVMTDNTGIYGKNVLIDHGCGLFSHYAHLTRVSVNVGDRLEKGDILGTTGLTGMVGGDHLHFGVVIGSRFVNPMEWLDAKWVENNILSKIRSVEAGEFD
ncbi:M23 family metallopeptidase [Desulfococcaceae bacterium OttesenSCG-928-F15]|nr:M23 family metallopeptidase [Desulfococcaceae bacterium OttesenSCG-928-F15]